MTNDLTSRHHTISSLRRWGRSALRLFLLLGFLSGRKDRAAAVYERMLSDSNYLGEKSLFLNLGFWRVATTYDDACEALAMELAEAAGLQDEERVLDAGFGFGDQDLLWANRYALVSFYGVNITPNHVAVAASRLKEAGIDDRVRLFRASAVQLPFARESFHKVLSLEASFHFPTREDFFCEASRVLLPGGIIALADIGPVPDASRFSGVISQFFGRSFWQIPAENFYDRDTYKRKLEGAGFEEVTVRSIREDVYPGFMKYARRRLEEEAMKSRLDPLIRFLWRAAVRFEGPWKEIDYFIATARKPS